VFREALNRISEIAASDAISFVANRQLAFGGDLPQVAGRWGCKSFLQLALSQTDESGREELRDECSQD
jgi:hypothetical protein